MSTLFTNIHLLIVDDDEGIRVLLKKFLLRHEYRVSSARDALHARRLLVNLKFDLIVLDIMMPNEDGLSLTRWLRKVLSTPILLLSARRSSSDKIKGLEAGADDYLSKPFEPKELVLRINAILRRVPPALTPNPPRNLIMGDVRYDIVRQELWCGNNFIHLTTTEATLMRIFSMTPYSPVSRRKILYHLASNDAIISQERAVDVQITRLRRKLEINPKKPRYLQTIRSKGYMLVPDQLQRDKHKEQ